jgi:hypothetical protein
MSTEEQATIAEQSDIELAPEESAILTPFDCLAHDIMRKDARAKEMVVPCWLTCSAEARAEARRNALVTLRLATGALSMSEEEAAATCARLIPASTIEAWKGAELAMKRERAAHNPHGWFAL